MRLGIMTLLNGLKKIKSVLIAISIPVITGIIITVFDNFYKENPQTIVKNTIILDSVNITDTSTTIDRTAKNSRRETDDIKKETLKKINNVCSGNLDDSIDCPL